MHSVVYNGHWCVPPCLWRLLLWQQPLIGIVREQLNILTEYFSPHVIIKLRSITDKESKGTGASCQGHSDFHVLSECFGYVRKKDQFARLLRDGSSWNTLSSSVLRLSSKKSIYCLMWETPSYSSSSHCWKVFPDIQLQFSINFFP